MSTPVDRDGSERDQARRPADDRSYERPVTASPSSPDGAAERGRYDTASTHDAGAPAEHRTTPVTAAPADRQTTAGTTIPSDAAATTQTARHYVVEREKQEFGGMKLGSAFFGWLCAMGMTVLLTALVAGAGAALGLGAQVDPEQVAQDDADTIGIVGLVAVAAILLISYYCGGYVAGRMARFSGLKQGIAVWLWAIVIAIVVAVVAAIGGAQWNILANVNSFPRLPFSEGELTTVGIITAVGALLVSLLGAILGGLAGMRYHRKVDRVGLGR